MRNGEKRVKERAALLVAYNEAVKKYSAKILKDGIDVRGVTEHPLFCAQRHSSVPDASVIRFGNRLKNESLDPVKVAIQRLRNHRSSQINPDDPYAYASFNSFFCDELAELEDETLSDTIIGEAMVPVTKPTPNAVAKDVIPALNRNEFILLSGVCVCINVCRETPAMVNLAFITLQHALDAIETYWLSPSICYSRLSLFAVRICADDYSRVAAKEDLPSFDELEFACLTEEYVRQEELNSMESAATTPSSSLTKN